ncbi:MAG: glycine-rich domain-containing protein [Planctomycetaceae bacterium]
MAVSSTVSPGIVLQDGQTVTISDLNKLGTPTVSIDGAVGTLSLTDGSVTNAKVASAAGIQLDKIQTGSSAQLIVASSSGVPTYVTLTGATITNAGVVSLDADSVDSDQYVDGSIDTAHLADDAVTAGKLDDLLTDSGGTAAAYTNASITVDATGRVSAVASGPSEPAGFEFGVITGNSTWTKPTGATLIRVLAVGAGGGGGSGYSLYGGGYNLGGAGGAGGAVSDWIDVTSVSSVAVTIGSVGAGASGAGYGGSAGTATLFGSYLTAGGGAGGSAGNSGAAGSAGSTGSVSGSQDSAEVTTGTASGKGNGGAAAAATGAGSAGIAGVVVVQVIR